MNRRANVGPDAKPRSVDPAALAMIEVAAAANIPTPWDRLAAQQPQCKFGTMGICCRNCFMGPCRIDSFGQRAQVGVCGAGADTIVARNLLRHICTGTSAHSDHSRDMVHALLLAAEGKSQAYRVRGIRKLHRLAEEYGISRDGRTDQEIAQCLADFLLDEFGKQKGKSISSYTVTNLPYQT